MSKSPKAWRIYVADIRTPSPRRPRLVLHVMSHDQFVRARIVVTRWGRIRAWTFVMVGYQEATLTETLRFISQLQPGTYAMHLACAEDKWFEVQPAALPDL